MQGVLLVICALGYGFLPATGEFQNAALTVLVPISLGLIYFVLHRHDWPPPLVPWLFASASVGRVAAYGWMNSRHGRTGSLVDEDVRIFGGLAAVSFAFALYRWMRNQSEIPNPADPKST